MRFTNVSIRIASVLVAAAAASAAYAGDRHDRTDVRVWPAVGFAGTDAHVVVHLAPNAENRRLVIAVESESFSRVSETALEGLRAPQSHTLDLRALPAGAYVLEVIVVDSAGRESRLQRKFFRE